MFSLILKLVLRNLLRNKLYHFIGISGLSIAITCAFFILFWINYEVSYDLFHEKQDRIFRFTTEVNAEEYYEHFARTSDPKMLQMPEYFPEIESMIRLQPMRNARVMIDNEKFFCNRFFKVDSSFFDVFSIRMINGDPKKALSEPWSLVISESIAEKYFGDTNPVGKEIYTAHQFDSSFVLYTVTGVMEDFHYYTMSKEVKPMIMFQQPVWYFCFLIKISGSNIPESVEYVRQTWNKTYPDYPFVYSYMDDLYTVTYRKEIAQSKIISIFSILTIIIACLGLFGLLIYFAELCTKEIGIRKVNGATIYDIIYLLNKESVILICISFLLATPVSIFIMKKWLMNFAYRINIPGWIFITVFIGILFILFITVSYQSLKAASRNPVNSLRYE